MEKPEERLYSIGELSRRCGVTVRTLQYYDRTGLLKASFSEGGRRMYAPGGVVRLQQILFLKSLGFSLEKIGGMIRKDPRDLAAVFAGQREILKEQAGNLEKMIGTLDAVIAELGEQKPVGVDKLMVLLELMKQRYPYTFVLHYLSDKDMEALVNRFGSAEQGGELMETAKGLFAEMTSLHQSGADPSGGRGQMLAKRWWDMVTEFTNGDAGLLNSLMSAGNDMEHWPEETGEFRAAMEAFLAPALDTYFRKNHIQFTEEGKADE